MSNEPKTGAQEGQPQQADAPDSIQLKVHGKTVEMPIEKVKTLAQQGLNQSRVQEQIAADRAQLEQDSGRYSEFQKLRSHLEANPRVAEAVQRALQDPDSVLTPRESAPVDDWSGESTVSETAKESVVGSAELNDLRRQVAEMKAKEEQRDEREATTMRSEAISTEVSSYPWLESGRAQEMAKSQIAAVMSQDPTADLASVTAIVANDMRELLEDAKTSQARAVPDRRRLQTERPQRGAPPVTSTKTPTKADLVDGSLLKLTKEAARSFGLPVD